MMFLRFFIMLLLIGAGLGGLFYWKIEQDKAQQAAMAGRQMPPVSVETDFARLENWLPTLKAIGSLAAIDGIELKAETSGRIVQLNVQSGAEIEKGSLLLKLDDSEEQAELRAQQAQLKLARLDHQRDTTLSKQRSIAESTLDKSRAQLEKAEADIARLQAVIAKKQVRAPFSGRLGLRQVDMGEYLKEGQVISSLQSLDPLYVNILLPEKDLPQLHLQQNVEVHLDAFPDQVFPGKISAIDAQINQQTRNITVQATLTNPGRKLLPGMFAKVNVLLDRETPVVSVAETAVSYSLYGDAVFVVNPVEGGDGALQVERRYVKLGRSRDGRVAIVDGIREGEQVVAAGGLKLRDGAKVTVKSKEPAPQEG